MVAIPFLPFGYPFVFAFKFAVIVFSIMISTKT